MPGPIICGVTGLARHGKDSIATYMVEQFGFQQFSFAATLKSMALVLDPIVACFTDFDEAYNDTAVGQRLSEEVEAGGWEGAKKNPEVRRFLQVLGTEAVRDHLGEQTWVNACKLAIDNNGADRVVISDCRFPNEADAIHEWGGTVLRVERPGFDNGVDRRHPSEAHVMSLPADVVIQNDGTLDDLNREVDLILTEMVIRATVPT